MDVSTQNKYDALPWYIRFLLDFRKTHLMMDSETTGLGLDFQISKISYKTLFGTTYILSKTNVPLNKPIPKQERARVKW